MLLAAEFWKGKRVLELGAGVGVCGLLAANLGARVKISEGSHSLLPVLVANTKINKILGLNAEHEPEVCFLDWGVSNLAERFGACPDSLL